MVQQHKPERDYGLRNSRRDAQSEGGGEMSDTPISDSTPHNVAELGMLCRRLERELSAANSIIRQQQLLDEANLRLQDRIKRLEAAGDEAICPFEYAARVRIWTEAKEAKP
jgi:hypothetical protein